ncbi:MAG TPA: FG-GAP-like repeat-containing protein [Iamia sp.]
MHGFRKAAAITAAATMAFGLTGCEPPETWWPTVLEVPGILASAVVGDFDEDGLEDIYWYAPGSDPEEMWTARPEGGFDRAPAPAVTGRYSAVAGDFDGDGDDDVLWVGVGGRVSALWTFEGGAVASKRTVELGRVVSGDSTVVIERSSGPDHVGLVLGTSTTVEDRLAIWDPLRGATSSGPPLHGGRNPQTYTGDFDGDGYGDVFLHRSGSATDSFGWGRADGQYDSQTITVYGRHLPAVLDADGDGRDDIAFFAERHTTASSVPVWRGQAGRWFAKASVGAPTVVGDTWVQEDRGDGRDNVIVRAERGDDQVWELGADGATIVHTIIDFDGGVPLLGQFSAADRDDMYLWNDRLLLSPQG